MRVHLYTSLGALKVGMDIMLKQEHVKLDRILGHGGLFKTKGVGQSILAGAIETAGEGGAWGIALLASYLVHKEEGESLPKFLSAKVFAGETGTVMGADPKEVAGFDTFIERYKEGFAIERAAVDHLK